MTGIVIYTWVGGKVEENKTVVCNDGVSGDDSSSGSISINNSTSRKFVGMIKDVIVIVKLECTNSPPPPPPHTHRNSCQCKFTITNTHKKKHNNLNKPVQGHNYLPTPHTQAFPGQEQVGKVNESIEETKQTQQQYMKLRIEHVAPPPPPQLTTTTVTQVRLDWPCLPPVESSSLSGR